LSRGETSSAPRPEAVRRPFRPFRPIHASRFVAAS
jgi:hypothetical protein